MVKKTFLAVLLIGASLWLFGCQTVKGLGGDIKWMGEKSAEAMEGE